MLNLYGRKCIPDVQESLFFYFRISSIPGGLATKFLHPVVAFYTAPLSQLYIIHTYFASYTPVLLQPVRYDAEAK